ncbi:MAG: sigma-70 family RNA polymerase sigma factor [Bacteroidales bacterium]|nr:sigma-70 family RNA polymerase sigma factor [Bacteroidales bacterium]
MTRKAFIEEVLPFSKMIYRVSFRILQDSEKARDMVQNIFCKLWDKKDKLDAVQNKEAFIMQTTKNACLDSLRTRKLTTELEQHHRITEPAYDTLESAALVRRAIADLPEKQRLIIELRDIEGMSFESMAEMLDTPVNTLRVSLSIARKKVREAVRKIYSYGT